MAAKYRRISVAVDDKITQLLEKLSKNENKTISDVIRAAIVTYAEMVEGHTDVEHIKKYEELLMKRDHVIVDIEIWIALLDYINKQADEKLWETIESIGYESGLEFKLKGLSFKDVLKHLEFKNISETRYEDGVAVLTLTSRSEVKILTHYLRGVLKALNIDAEILPGVRKIVIVEKGRE